MSVGRGVGEERDVDSLSATFRTVWIIMCSSREHRRQACVCPCSRWCPYCSGRRRYGKCLLDQSPEYQLRQQRHYYPTATGSGGDGAVPAASGVHNMREVKGIPTTADEGD